MQRTSIDSTRIFATTLQICHTIDECAYWIILICFNTFIWIENHHWHMNCVQPLHIYCTQLVRKVFSAQISYHYHSSVHKLFDLLIDKSIKFVQSIGNKYDSMSAFVITQIYWIKYRMVTVIKAEISNWIGTVSHPKNTLRIGKA